MFLLASTTVLLGLCTTVSFAWFFLVVTGMEDSYHTVRNMFISVLLTFLFLNLTVVVAQHTDELYPGTFTKEKQ